MYSLDEIISYLASTKDIFSIVVIELNQFFGCFSMMCCSFWISQSHWVVFISFLDYLVLDADNSCYICSEICKSLCHIKPNSCDIRLWVDLNFKIVIELYTLQKWIINFGQYIVLFIALRYNDLLDPIPVFEVPVIDSATIEQNGSKCSHAYNIIKPNFKERILRLQSLLCGYYEFTINQKYQ